ncbi:MAG: BlaI/MecI/CopY family transcriptional regulator [Peptococcaceae bacterium]|nr:BlaI/MecI/CopY family transcriptional regulator [Peptococcaceae bacterium]
MPTQGKKKEPKLSEAEMEIMAIIWEGGGPLTSNFILDHLTGRAWALSTVMTALARLCEKGFVYCDRSTRTNYYTTTLTRDEYLERESRDFLEKMHGNSIASMVTALNNSGAINEEDLNELRKILDKK